MAFDDGSEGDEALANPGALFLREGAGDFISADGERCYVDRGAMGLASAAARVNVLLDQESGAPGLTKLAAPMAHTSWAGVGGSGGGGIGFASEDGMDGDQAFADVWVLFGGQGGFDLGQSGGSLLRCHQRLVA